MEVERTDELVRALENEGLSELRTRLSSGTPRLRVTGLLGPARALLEAAFAARAGRPVLLLVGQERRVPEVVADTAAFLSSVKADVPVLPFPSLEVDPYRGLGPHFEAAAARARALAAFMDARPALIVAPAAAALLRTASPSIFARGMIRIRRGESIEPARIVEQLIDAGYLFEDPVVSPGDFARRGGILDVYPPGSLDPLRLEFVGDTLEEIRRFSPETQRTTGPMERAVVEPAREWIFGQEERRRLVGALKGRVRPDDERVAKLASESFPAGTGFALPLLEDYRSTIFDYVGKGPVLIEEPAEVSRCAVAEWERILDCYRDASERGESGLPEPSELLLTPDDLLQTSSLSIEEMDVLDESMLHVSSQLLPSFRGRVKDFVGEIRRQLERDVSVHVFVGNRSLGERLVEILQEERVSAAFAVEEPDAAGAVAIHLGHLSHGFLLPGLGQAVFSGRDVFAEPPRPERRRIAKLGRFLSDFRDLRVGDFVVHTEHGIGVFTGLRQIASGTGGNEFVVLEYQGGDKLYVPVEKLDLLEKYSSSEGSKPRLDKLGGTGWERVTRRVRKSMQNMARELLRLYAARKAISGHRFSPDTHWQQELEGLFEYQETPDQQQAIGEVKHDMEATFPMDRLLCGDVGYGKTEVAMRAAFKAVMDGKQVAVLVPTTVLAFQHQETFSLRFGPFPVRVEMLSRFRSTRERKSILNDLAAGAVDVIIGTHRLLSKDVTFKDLGLIIVDEEQRFGVAHKERLKQLRQRVDCLTMTATPIPRTLHMSMAGVRDLSVIETPPKDRMAIQTYITRLDSKLIAEAIRHELARSGQVYFVHNRVSSIYSMASFLSRMVPEARIGVAHGQMKENELEKTMLRFVRGEFDVLVSTTIIENGLDIPLVNTLIVNRADRFGLSQLYQLRGRVGRSNRRAYAYLLVPDESTLTPIARRRLAAIREFSDLGAGFRIAALDLELRGAGNLLGSEQHGHIEAVGFDMYCRLLEQTVGELSGEEPESPRVALNLKIDVKIPESYIPDINQRMSIYKRVSGAGTEAMLDEVTSELRDRYGQFPASVEQLLEYGRLKLLAGRMRLQAIDRDGSLLVFRLGDDSPVDVDKLVGLTERFSGIRVTPGGVLKLVVESGRPADIMKQARQVLLELTPCSRMEVSSRHEEARI